eukprot:TRINITY_DN71574_c0_g1_i1.p1 TRINITY_DN71574_c0_g1~~TRINITY_DN71574_c0_g1_i1.p1  ORF type:complete len:400 (-),score=60.40 TRINITY_DN71574_c0_g1_i1:124-1323(-)
MEEGQEAAAVLPWSSTIVYAWVFTIGMCVGLAIAFRHAGPRGIALILGYLSLLVTTQLTVHWVVHDLGFPYSSFLTFLQFAVLWLGCWSFCGREDFVVREVDTGREMRINSRCFWQFYAVRIAPIGLTIAGATAANNASLGLIDPGMNAIVSSMTPACTGLISALLGARYPWKAWLGLVVSTAGGAFAVKGGLDGAGQEADTASSSHRRVLGMVLSYSSLVLRALKAVVMERAVRQVDNGKSSKSGQQRGGAPAYPVLSAMQALVFQTPSVALIMLILAAMDPAGLVKPATSLLQGGEGSSGPLLMFGLALNIASANALNFVGLQVMKMIGATPMQVVGRCNVCVTMALSAAYVGEVITLEETLGAALVLTSAGLFASKPASTAAAKSTLAASHPLKEV